MRLRDIATTAIVAGLVNVSVASAQSVPADLTKARTERRDAMMNGDRTAFDRLTTADFVVVDQTGRVENKAERGARTTPPANAPRGGGGAPQRMNERSAVYNNDTAVLFWQQTTQQGLQNFMETWVKDGGQWKCAAVHLSLPAAGGGGGGREGGRGGGRGGN